jgi:DNA-binding MarR family transcriptional regulator
MAERYNRKAASRRSGSVNFSLADAPGHLLRRAQQYAFDVYAREVGGDGLTPRQFAVLLTVDQNEGLSQTDLVRLTGIDRSTLADMISRLIKRDLLARRRTEMDARANAVRITTAGRRALKVALPGVRRAEAHVLDPLPSGRRREFLNALTTLAEAADALMAESEGESARTRGGGRKRRSTRRSGR